MNVSRLDGSPQRRTGCKQPALTDHFVQRSWTHAFGKRFQCFVVDVQQVSHGPNDTASAAGIAVPKLVIDSQPAVLGWIIKRANGRGGTPIGTEVGMAIGK